MKTNTESTGDIRIGLRIRHTRLLRGLKLRELAELLGCSESFLSKVENDKVQPSLSMLHKIVSALEINIPSLFADTFASESDPVYISRKTGRLALKTGPRSKGASIAIERLILTDKGALLEANIHVVEPGGHTDGFYSHEGEEFGYLLQGTLDLQVADKHYQLNEGDSFAFRSELPHGYSNPGTEEARILWANTPPTF